MAKGEGGVSKCRQSLRLTAAMFRRDPHQSLHRDDKRTHHRSYQYGVLGQERGLKGREEGETVQSRIADYLHNTWINAPAKKFKTLPSQRSAGKNTANIANKSLDLAVSWSQGSSESPLFLHAALTLTYKICPGDRACATRFHSFRKSCNSSLHRQP